MKRRIPLFALIAFLMFAAGWLLRGYNAAHYSEVILKQTEKNLDAELNIIQQEAHALLRDGITTASRSWETATHFFFFIDSGKVIGWNRTQFMPQLSGKQDTIRFLSSANGDFLLKTWTRDDHSYLYCLLTLSERYQITNNFLTPQLNSAIFPDKEVILLLPEDINGLEVKSHNRTMFRIIVPGQEQRESLGSFILLTGAVILLLFLLWDLLALVAGRVGRDVAFLSLLLALSGLRYGMEQISLPALYFHSDLFDPRKFASSSINASMGDLFLNSLSVFFVIIYGATHFRSFRSVNWVLRLRGSYRWLAAAATLLCCFLGVLFAFNFVEVIYHNSGETLDITQSLKFDAVRSFAVVSVVLGCLTSFLFIHLFFLLTRDLLDDVIGFATALLMASLLFWLYYRGISRDFSITLYTGIILLGLLRVLDFRKETFANSFSIFLYLICMIFGFSLQTAWASKVFGEERQVNNQFRFGKDFLTERDFLGEYLLDQAGRQIAADPFIQARMLGPFYSNSSVVDKIRRVHLNRYFDRYETEVEIHNEPPGKTSLVDFLPRGYTPTGYPGIGYSSTTEGTSHKGYYAIIPVGGQRAAGYIMIRLSLKRIIPNNVYPELLVDNRFSQIYRSRDFSYAIFNHGSLVNSFGSYNYERDFSFAALGPALFERGAHEVHYYHVAIESSDEVVAVVSAASPPRFSSVANFSFWFVLGLTFLFVGQGAYGFYSITTGQQVNYAARIQLFIFLAFLVPAIAISATTLTLIGRSNEEAIQSEFLDRATSISQQLASLFDEQTEPESLQTRLEQWIEENAASAKLDITVYSSEGRLLVTSQPALLDNQLISPLMDHQAWERLVLDKDVQTVTNENIGKLQYSCAYAAIQSPATGKLVAIVGLPFFESASFLQRSQVQILSNILIVFVIAFILFSFLSFWASRSLTFPIRFITRMLGQTTLTGKNMPIEWHSSDEIGILVREYNRMVKHLEESKEALAKSEKEVAWREMARQVAHEIKNPLTPMRLTLQQMEKNLLGGSLSEEKSKKSIEVLLRQVDILNQIADSFSLFARMPSAAAVPVDVNVLLQSVVNLLSSGTAEFTFEPDPSKPLVMADQPALSRGIANILINGMQASKEGQEKIHIVVKVSTLGQKVLITIHDDGRGMTKEVQEKVFQPHFTTKESGSGLGLAMARQIIDQAGGSVRFESVLNLGTTFFIELPLSLVTSR